MYSSSKYIEKNDKSNIDLDIENMPYDLNEECKKQEHGSTPKIK